MGIGSTESGVKGSCELLSVAAGIGTAPSGRKSKSALNQASSPLVPRCVALAVLELSVNRLVSSSQR